MGIKTQTIIFGDISKLISKALIRQKFYLAFGGPSSADWVMCRRPAIRIIITEK